MPDRDTVYDLLVIGTGIAGLSCAIRAAEAGLRTCVLTKEAVPSECNTNYAQGGIVARAASGDSPELLARDIIEAGDFLNSREAVDIVAAEGPAAVEEVLLGKLGVPFDRGESGAIDRTMEAAHSVRRIYHVKDTTGAAIEASLLAYAARCPNLELRCGKAAVDIITNTHHSLDNQQRYKKARALGVYVFDEASGTVETKFASATVLATGGAGNLYLHTSNPSCATGDGIAMAARAGVPVLNAEYVQFHPTVLFHRDIKRFLISESLRGEGARLMNRQGEYFMERYEPELKDLAPRDKAARAIYLEMEATDSSYVLLDTRGIDADVASRFPAIYATCREAGIDIRREPIPVVPAAHYFCGGVKTDSVGKTDIEGLYAIGETACTGVHGANRLASVSLLEGLVYGLRAADAIGREAREVEAALLAGIPDWVYPKHVEDIDPILIGHDLQNVQTTMWDYVGIIRTRKRLARALADLNYLAHRVESFYKEARISKRLIELRGGVVTAQLIASAASSNPNSLGSHFLA